MSNLLNRGNERNRPGMRRVQRWKILRDVERKRMQGMGKLYCRHVRLSGRVAESEPRMHRVRLWKVYKCIQLGRVPEMDRVTKSLQRGPHCRIVSADTRRTSWAPPEETSRRVVFRSNFWPCFYDMICSSFNFRNKFTFFNLKNKFIILLMKVCSG